MRLNIQDHHENKTNLTRVLLLAGSTAVIILAIVLLLVFTGTFNRGGSPVLRKLDHGTSSQYVTPFGNNYLYYDNSVLYCYDTGNSLQWSNAIGSGAHFTASDNIVAAWAGTKLVIINSKGVTTYNSQLTDTIQFVRCGNRYIAVVTGEDIDPTLYVKDIDGNTVDSESSHYVDMMLLDAGFFAGGDYLWTTSLDVYGTVPNILLRTYNVGVTDNGVVSLGENLVYRILYANQDLNIISTQRLRHFDYHGTENTSASQLIYGWILIHDTNQKGGLQMLYARANQVGEMDALTDLRYLSGNTDKLYTLPNACVGAVIYNNAIYAFSNSTIYRSAVNAQRFSAIDLGTVGSRGITGFLCLLKDGTALLASGPDIYAVKLN